MIVENHCGIQEYDDSISTRHAAGARYSGCGFGADGAFMDELAVMADFAGGVHHDRVRKEERANDRGCGCWLAGRCGVRVTGASLTRFLNLCAAQGITLRRMDRTAWNELHATCPSGISDAQAAHGPHGMPRAYLPENAVCRLCGASASAYGALGGAVSLRAVLAAARMYGRYRPRSHRR